MATYVTVQLTPEAREAIRRVAFTLTGHAGRRVTLSDALTAACAVAERHIEQTAEALPEGTDT